jgi:cation diffusion facilitator family transporter
MTVAAARMCRGGMLRSPTGEDELPPSESFRTVVVAMLANAGVALAKLAAGLFTGSSAMLAEAIHAGADTGNEALLLIAERRGARPPDDQHPLGHGREAYFWALLASLLVFLTGALASVRQGVEELIRPTPTSAFPVAYLVLAVSFCLDGVSLWRAYRQLRSEATGLDRDFLEHLDLTSDPITRAVFAEDAVALGGNVIAALGIALHQITRSPIPDGIAAILVGLTLGYVAFDLARRNGDFLIGRQAPPALRRLVESVIAAQPGIQAVKELLVIFLGPRRLSVVARVDVDEGLSGERLKEVLAETELALARRSPYIARVDLVPIC